LVVSDEQIRTAVGLTRCHDSDSSGAVLSERSDNVKDSGHRTTARCLSGADVVDTRPIFKSAFPAGAVQLPLSLENLRRARDPQMLEQCRSAYRDRRFERLSVLIQGPKAPVKEAFAATMHGSEDRSVLEEKVSFV